ncbi:MAG: SurA N-terminal domain-containing protein [Caulobacteraceae bacterium]
MLAQIRTFAKSPAAKVLLGVLVASFAVFGIRDVFHGQMEPDAIVQAGKRSVGPAEFKRTFDNYRDQLQKQNNQTLTAEDADKAGLLPRMIDSLAFQKSFDEFMARVGVRPSDKLVLGEIRKAPIFFDQVTGKFDRKAYDSWLAQNNLTAAQLESDLRDGLSENHFASGLVAGLQAPRAYGAVAATFQKEGRSFSGFLIDPRSAGEPPKPTDAELLKFMKDTPQRFTKPETRQLSFVHFSAAAVAASTAVTPADLQKRFDFEKDSLSTPEKRTVVSIPIADASKGADVAARLKRGEDPGAVAKSLGVQPAVYPLGPKTAISDRKVADAAFGLKEGEVAGPLQGTLGTAVIKVMQVVPGHAVTLDEVRAKIEAEVKKDQATEKVYDLVQKYDDARSGGATLAEAAKKVGATVTVLPAPVSPEGIDLQGRKSELPEAVLKAAFALPASGESETIDASQGEYFAVRADKLFPSTLATVDEVRGPVTQLFVLDVAVKRLRAKADALAAEIRKGKTIEAAAESVGAKVGHAVDIHRDAADGKAFSRDLIAKVFGAKVGDVLVGEDVRLGFIVAKLEKVAADAGPEIARAAEDQRRQMSAGLMQDFGMLARNAARDVIKPKTDLNRARSALGLEAVAAPAPGAKPAAGNKL